MPDLNKEDMKSAVKDAIKEWLDEQFQTFGRWSFYSFVSVALAAIVYFMMGAMGWHK